MGIIGNVIAGGVEGAALTGRKIGLDAIEAQIREDAAARLQENQARLQAESQGREFAFRRDESAADRTFRSGESALDRTSREGIHRDDRTSREREAEENRKVDRERIGEQSRHNEAVEKIQAATEGRLGKSADLDNAIKQIGVDNAKRVEALRKEFGAATPERQKAITEEVQLLTGKDNDNYLPVPLKDDQGNVTGYQVFDRKRGQWVDTRPPAKEPTPAHIDALKARSKDPKAAAAFDAQYGVGAAARVLGSNPTVPEKPKTAPTGGTSGSHVEPQSRGLIGGAEDRAIRAEIMDKRRRLGFAGISQDTKDRLTLELAELERKIENPGASNMPMAMRR